MQMTIPIPVVYQFFPNSPHILLLIFSVLTWHQQCHLAHVVLMQRKWIDAKGEIRLGS